MWAWLQKLLGYAAHIDPPVFACASRAEAWQRAGDFAAANGGSIEITSGTPSMVPLIPAAPTFTVIIPIPFPEARLGTVVSYLAAWLNNQSVTHRLISGNVRDGFIPSGDNNRYSEPSIRVTAANFVGEVRGIYTFPSTA